MVGYSEFRLILEMINSFMTQPDDGMIESSNGDYLH